MSLEPPNKLTRITLSKPTPKCRHKVAFTKEDDALLMKYIATYNPQRRGRLGIKLYEKLIENAERKWSFSSHHPAQSWRERYKQNQPRFDAQILKYQKKHGISVDASDNISSQITVQGSRTMTQPTASRLPHNGPSRSGAPVGESGAKKRLRELDSDNDDIDSGVAKMVRREKVPVQRSRVSDSPPYTRSRPQNGEEARAESSLLSHPAEDKAALAIGPNDYTGALSGSGESEREGELQPEGKAVNAPARPFGSPDKAEMEPSVALRKSTTPTLVGTTTGPSPSHLLRDRSSRIVLAEAPGLVRDSVVTHAQPSQEPTPPHTSAISSPRSPLPRQSSLDPLQPEISPGHIPPASLKKRRIPSSPRKRTIVSGEEDDIFSTPPPQTVASNPPRGTRGKQVPRLLEGPFRSVYATANREFRPEGGMDEEAEVGSKGKEWPPMRGKQQSPISEGQNTGNSTSLQEREQPPPLSSALSTSNTVPANESRPAARKDVPLQVAQVTTSAVAQTSKGPRGPIQSNARPSFLQNQLPNSERNLGSIQPKVSALEANSSRLLFPAVSTHKLPPPVPGPPSKRASLDQYPNPATRNDPSIGDPFIVPPANRGTRRRTLEANGGFARANARKDEPIRRASVQHIDLRKLPSSKGSRTSLAGSIASLGRSNSSNSSSVVKKKLPRRSRRSSIQPNLSESNKELVLVLGLEAVYSRMAENHKFHVDVVREVASRQRSLEDTDRVLRNMREAAGREYARMLRQEYEAEESEEENEEEDVAKIGNREDDDHAVRPTRAPLRSNHSPPSSLPQGRPRRLGLKITTESPDSSPMRPPHYSPPTPTRAHEFRRLERQGRVEEARLREARRVRHSLQPNSAEASPEVDEHKVTAYLLQLQEGDAGGALPEKLWNVSISPGLEEGRVDEDTGQFQGNGIAEDDGAQVSAAFVGDDLEMPDDDVHDNDPSSPFGFGHDFSNEDRFDEDAALMDSKLHQMSGLGDEDAETAEVEEQLDANVGHRTLSHLQATGPEDSPVADNAGSAAHERQTLQEDVLAKGARRDEYGVNAASLTVGSALDSLSLLDATWTNSDDELLLDGDLVAHRELVKRKGLCSVKFRTAHLYGLLLDG